MKNEKLSFKEIVFFLYFSIMMNLYTHTVIQLLAQVVVIVYIIVKILRSGKYSISKNVVFYIKWYGLFVCWIILSSLWTKHQLFEGYRTYITVVRIFIVGFFISIYLSMDKNNIVNLFRSYCYAGILFVIICFLSNPVVAFGNERFTSLDGGFVRTGIAEICFNFIIFCYYFYKKGLFSSVCFYMIEMLFFICIIATGARKPLLMIVVFVTTILLLQRKYFAFLKCMFLAIMLVALLTLICPNFVYNQYHNIRSIFMFNNSTDASVVGRFTYIKEALKLSKLHLIKGMGVDSFKYYLSTHRVMTSFGILAPTYTHCNYVEILLNFGLVGIVLWYSFYYKILKKHGNIIGNTYSNIIFSILFTWLLGDIGAIIYMSHVLVYFYVILIYISDYECAHN